MDPQKFMYGLAAVPTSMRHFQDPRTGQHASSQRAKVVEVVKNSIQNVSAETLALMVAGPWFATTVAKGVVELASKNRSSHITYDREKLQATKYRGKQFLQTDSKDKVDLSWKGALPYWFAIAQNAIESVLLNKYGDDYFKQRGFTPGERQILQIYIFFIALPLVDLLAGADYSNPTKKQQREHQTLYRFKLPLYIWTATEFLLTVATMRTVLNPNNKFSLLSKAAMIVQLGLFNGVFGINISHELLHKHNRFERALAWALLTNVNYCHWMDEHESGHHQLVATPLDAATAREGETLYAFLPRSFFGGWKHACRLESQRLLKEERIKTWFTWKNRVIRGALGSFIWSLILARLARSWKAIPLFYAQGTLAALILEVINYIEHFGLMRKFDKETQKYEPVDPRHSWNSPYRFSNTILFKLQRHSDHHTFPSRPYELLRNFVESPQMPCGYIGMFVLAWFPPVFFHIMNPLLEAHRLEFSSDTPPDDAVLERIAELKQAASRRIWLWTGSVFGISSASFLLAHRRGFFL